MEIALTTATTQVFRVELDCEVETTIHRIKEKGDVERGLIIMVDLRKKVQVGYVGPVSAKKSPEKTA